MTENDEQFLNDHFFIIDSLNCDKYNSKFFGFILDDDSFSNSYNSIIQKDCYGTYINIIKNNEELIIQQDYYGSYGIFVYEDPNYFAISNSLLYLANFLKNKKSLSINEDYVKTFLCCDLVPLIFEETIFNEITQLSKNYCIHINTKLKKNNKVKKRIYRNCRYR